jgi:carbamoyl-phosphate synthase large subunit
VPEAFNVLISSAGRRVALVDTFRQALRELGLRGDVLATDITRLSSAFHAADRGFIVPRCTSPDFVPCVLEICRANDVGLVVPTTDRELDAYAGNRHRFLNQGVAVAVSSPEVVDIAWDKRATNEWLVGNGFPTVRQGTVDEALAHLDRWRFPLLVKPRNGSSSIGVAVVGDRTELEVATRPRAEEFVVETVADGEEYTIDILVNSHGRCVCAVPRRRIEVRGGESSKGMTVRSVRLEELARRVAEALPGAWGPLTLQAFLEADSEKVSIIEVNPRFGGGFPLSWEAGAKYPKWLIEDVLGLPSTASADSWMDGRVMLRYDEAVFVGADQMGRTGG